jgi:sec-independent protein translocase protein TatA
MSAFIAIMLGTWEIIIVLVIALLLFGTRLPKVARSLGQGVREFKGGIQGIEDDVRKSAESEDSRKEITNG